jgi:alginate O-acetyltransferase complex protein AlgJ
MAQSREEQAKAEIGHTAVSRPMAVAITLVALAVLFGLPLAQFAAGWYEHRLAALNDTAGRVPPPPPLAAPSLSAFAEWRGLPAAMAEAARSAPTLWRRIAAPNAELLRRINAFSSRLDDSFILTRALQQPVQAALCRLGVGNEKAFLGRDGWLFYEPDVAHVTGRAFLDPRQLARRRLQGGELAAPQPDPVAGIVAFRNQLKARGIELIVMPTPVKPTIHGEPLTRRLPARHAPLRNASYAEFAARLEREGVRVFDCADLLAARKVAGPQYLKTDTHWRPDAMRAAASETARRARAAAPLPRLDAGLYSRTNRTVTARGDIALMLKLPAGQTRFPPETVSIEPIVAADGQPWKPDPAAPVLLLGDSFSAIYSTAEMNWGTAAGFAEQLSAELNLPVDRIVRNDAGACATREMLALELARGRDRLAGKKLVVWQFAARELSIGDWKSVALKVAAPPSMGPPSGVQAQPPVGGVPVTGVVKAVSDRPQTGAVYKDFVMRLHVAELTDSDGKSFRNGDGLICILAMRDRAILPPASWRVGERVSLRLHPWEAVESRYGSLRAGALADPTLEVEKTWFWAEPATP